MGYWQEFPGNFWYCFAMQNTNFTLEHKVFSAYWCSRLRAIMAAIVSDDPVVFFGSWEVKMPLWRHLRQLPPGQRGSW